MLKFRVLINFMQLIRHSCVGCCASRSSSCIRERAVHAPKVAYIRDLAQLYTWTLNGVAPILIVIGSGREGFNPIKLRISKVAAIQLL